MPAPRLPWVKLWVESLDHEKIEMLPDTLYRTWTRCLLRGAQQPTKWRFGSIEHAARVTARPARQIKDLIGRRLLDVRDDGLWVHDAPYWQDRHPSDFAPRKGDEDSAKSPPIKGGTLREDSANAPSSLREDSAKTPRRLRREGEGDRDSESRHESPDISDSSTRRPITKPAPKPSQKSPSVEPLRAAFESLGLRLPTFAAGEAVNAQALLETATPDLLARCWQDHVTADFPLADDFSRRNLSFTYLASHNRFGNWLTWHEAGRHQEPVRPARSNGRANAGDIAHDLIEADYQRELAAANGVKELTDGPH